MRIDDILTEAQLDEISMRDIARGAGKVASGLGTAVGGVKGAIAGLGDPYRAARDRAYAASRGAVTRANAPTATSITPQQATTASVQPTTTTAANIPSNTLTTTAMPVPTQSGRSTSSPAPTQSGRSTSSPATQLQAPPNAPGSLDKFKQLYSALSNAEREQLKKELDIIDDQDRLASGTNESLDDILKLARVK